MVHFHFVGFVRSPREFVPVMPLNMQLFPLVESHPCPHGTHPWNFHGQSDALELEAADVSMSRQLRFFGGI